MFNLFRSWPPNIGDSLIDSGFLGIFRQKQADVNSLLLLLGLVCHILPLMFRFVGTSDPELTAAATLELSRACSIIMLVAYIAYLAFQLFTHRQIFLPPKVSSHLHQSRILFHQYVVVSAWKLILFIEFSFRMKRRMMRTLNRKRQK